MKMETNGLWSIASSIRLGRLLHVERHLLGVAAVLVLGLLVPRPGLWKELGEAALEAGGGGSGLAVRCGLRFAVPGTVLVVLVHVHRSLLS